MRILATCSFSSLIVLQFFYKAIDAKLHLPQHLVAVIHKYGPICKQKKLFLVANFVVSAPPSLKGIELQFSFVLNSQ